MSHEIARSTASDGTTVDHFVSARVPAWHRLGQVFETEMTVTEAMEAAHLTGWNVRKIDLGGTDTRSELSEDGVTQIEEHVDFPNWKGVVRTNPVSGKTEQLGVVGAGYHHVQNEEHAEFLEALLDESGARFIQTAGALRGGRHVFYCAKLPSSMLIGGVDQVDTFISTMNGHDGTRALMAVASPIRVVCANTEAAAIGSASQKWSTRHTKGAARAIEDARKALSMTFKFHEAFEKEAERMIQAELTTGEFEKIIDGIFEPAREIDSPTTQANKKARTRTLIQLFEEADTQAAVRGTRWAGYNAVTEFIDHYADASGKGLKAKDTARALSAIDGKGFQLKTDAFAAFKPKAKNLLTV
jgi:phage/plasmid-like protein (TIGR03299 family)